MKRLLLITFAIFTFSFISCSDNGTGSDPESEPEPEPEQTTGTLEITTNTSGSDQDSDGYTLTFDGSDQSIGINETVTFEEQEEGSYEAELSDIADNCSVDGENPRSVDVVAEDITGTTFEVSCESVSGGGGTSSVLNNKIVFHSDRNDNDDIYVMDADGSNQLQLTDNPELDRHPVISNDGTKIAFVSYRDGAINIYTMDVDGTNIQQVTQSYDMPFSPHLSWSPDDSQIAFHDKRSGNGEFNEDEAFYNEIYTINIDGSNLTRLTDNDAFDGNPSWSPDGDKIVFNSSRDGGVNADQEIYTMNTDGSEPQKITDDPDQNHRARWSFDGSKFVFVSDRNGNDDIYTMNIDGSEVQRLTDYDGEDQNPAWSADGNEIVFVTNRDINREIYQINADGSGSTTNLTDNGATDEAPFWSPVE